METDRNPDADKGRQILLAYARYGAEALAGSLPVTRRKRLEKAMSSTLALLETELMRDAAQSVVMTTITRPQDLMTDIAALVETRSVQTGHSTAWQVDNALPSKLAAPTSSLILATLTISEYALSLCDSGVLMLDLSGFQPHKTASLTLTITLSASADLSKSDQAVLNGIQAGLGQAGGSLLERRISDQDRCWTITVPARRTETRGQKRGGSIQSRFDLTETGSCLVISQQPLSTTLSALLRGCGLDCLDYQPDMPIVSPGEISAIIIDRDMTDDLPNDWQALLRATARTQPVIALTSNPSDVRDLGFEPSSVAPKPASVSEIIALLDAEIMARSASQHSSDR
ncbi:hypothetical protein [Coralliovum pocilloporae]|uniref:hypothetical protein n=1 Tax=Coralliovum pocilloporae TaxID=3066369 RepID=UPI00330739EF